MTDLTSALGPRLQAAREARGLRGDDVTRAARRVGLRWSRVTVTHVETARRRLTGEELLLLPYLYETPLGKLLPPEWAGLLRGDPVPCLEPAGGLIDDTTHKAARRLGVSARAVDEAAHQLWGHGLAHERDRRVHDEASSPRSLQAMRGHVTRELMIDLRKAVNR